MSKLLIPDLDDTTLTRLRDRAVRHGRTVETEAKVILSDVLGSEDAWAGANAIFDQLSASGRTFSDSADLIREDRDR
jgi:plasmid stability protein